MSDHLKSVPNASSTSLSFTEGDRPLSICQNANLDTSLSCLMLVAMNLISWFPILSKSGDGQGTLPKVRWQWKGLKGNLS